MRAGVVKICIQGRDSESNDRSSSLQISNATIVKSSSG